MTTASEKDRTSMESFELILLSWILFEVLFPTINSVFRFQALFPDGFGGLGGEATFRICGLASQSGFNPLLLLSVVCVFEDKITLFTSSLYLTSVIFYAVLPEYFLIDPAEGTHYSPLT